MSNGFRRLLKRNNELENRICRILAGQAPEVQGSVVLCLMARYLAGYRDDVRAEMRSQMLQAMDDLVPVYRTEILEAFQKRERKH